MSFDATTRTFSFSQITDLGLSGSNFKVYTVLMTGTAGSITSVYGNASFNLRINNPCIDSNLVQIHPADLPSELDSYTLFSNSAALPYQIF